MSTVDSAKFKRGRGWVGVGKGNIVNNCLYFLLIYDCKREKRKKRNLIFFLIYFVELCGLFYLSFVTEKLNIQYCD